MVGSLVVVGTPIGNLGDLSERMRATLGEVDLLLAEDTRHTGRLLAHLGSDVRQRSLHEHNERERIPEVLALLAEGARVALVSDAGMPGVSDPGYRLVAACVDAGLKVEVVPGPSALTAALAVSGLPTDRVAFEGFLPRKGRARRERLEELADERRTLVLFASPHRLHTDLEDLAAALGPDRQAVLARELTKLHEQILRGTLAELSLAVADGVRGEVTLVVAGAARARAAHESTVGPADRDEPVAPDELVRRVHALIAAGQDKKQAIAAVAVATGRPKREVYQAVIDAAG